MFTQATIAIPRANLRFPAWKAHAIVKKNSLLSKMAILIMAVDDQWCTLAICVEVQREQCAKIHETFKPSIFNRF